MRRSTDWNNMLNRRMPILLVAGLALVWGIPWLADATAQDSHGDHDHAEHADESAGNGHDTENEHDDHSGHDDEDGDSDDKPTVTLTAKQIRLAEIRTVKAKEGEIHNELHLTGEVSLNQDRLVHITPRLPSIVKKVHKTWGDQVMKGDLLAELESRELADAKTDYLSAKEKLVLVQVGFDREKHLREKKLSTEQDFLDAKMTFVEAGSALRSSRQKLYALGLTEKEISDLPEMPDSSLTSYAVRAPFSGTVIERHATQGEQVNEENAMFAISDLSTLWLIADVYEKDIAKVKRGQLATTSVKAYPQRYFNGKVTWISDLINKETRTLKIRVELTNKDRLLKPGMFARIRLGVQTKSPALIIPRSSLLRFKGDTYVRQRQGSPIPNASIQTRKDLPPSTQIVSCWRWTNRCG